MASTTKTDNLQLSQFVGTDKPAWLTDYNGDMQKIDAGYKELKDANADTQADLDLTKQSLTNSDADIADLKTEVQDLQAQDTKFTNDITVLSANYETMHHEMVNNETELAAVNTDLNKDVALETQATTVHEAINELNEISNLSLRSTIRIYLSVDGDDNNDGLTRDKPIKTVEKAINTYSFACIIGLYFIKAGEYTLPIVTQPVRINFVGEVDGVILNTSGFYLAYSQFNNITINMTGTINGEAYFSPNCKIVCNGTIEIKGKIIFDNCIIDLNGNTFHVFALGAFYINTDNQIIDSAGNGKVSIQNTIMFIKVALSVKVEVSGNGVLIYNPTKLTPTIISPALTLQYT